MADEAIPRSWPLWLLGAVTLTALQMIGRLFGEEPGLAIALVTCGVALLAAVTILFAWSLTLARWMARKPGWKGRIRLASVLYGTLLMVFSIVTYPEGFRIGVHAIVVPLFSGAMPLAFSMVMAPAISFAGDLVPLLHRQGDPPFRQIIQLILASGLLAMGMEVFLQLAPDHSPFRADLPVWVKHVATGVLVLSTMMCFAAYASRKLVPRLTQLGPGEIERYRLLRPLGRGGMGQLFLATRVGPEGFERRVALKKILTEHTPDPEAIERFLSEARLAARLHHPNIVAVHDLGRLPDGWFIAMEHLDGLSLAQIRDRTGGPDLPAGALLEIGEQCCRGLAHAHAAGVIHRDISPQNVMVTWSGEVKIVDFGIAKSHLAVDLAGSELPSSPDLTARGVVMGKMGYLAPEQLEGKPAGPATDLFALGVVLYELAARVTPYPRSSRHPARGPTRERFIPLARIRSDLPPTLLRVIDRACACESWERFESAAGMGEALKAARAEAGPFELVPWLARLAQPGEQEVSPSAPTRRAEGST